jgi:hypothetical protein
MNIVEVCRIRIKEIFIADAQQNSRMCAPVNAVVHSIADKLLQWLYSGEVNLSTDEKIIVSYPYTRDALQAINFSRKQEIK